MSLDQSCNFEQLSKDEILNSDFLTNIFDTDDDVLFYTYFNALEDRAKELKCLTQYKRIAKAFEKEHKKIQKAASTPAKKDPQPEVENITNFPAGLVADFDYLKCGSWIANFSGVKKVFPNGDYVASLFPILPISYYQNINSSVEKVAVAYFKGGHWNYRVLLRSEISSTQEIIRKANFGMPVTSKTASALVEYFQDIEALNEEVIPIMRSTTKMGWHRTDDQLIFLPFTDAIAFDGDIQYHDLYSSIHEEGDYNIWLKAVKEIRATKRIEPLMFIAASFASPLLELLGVQSFALDLWGNTEGGKTVTLHLAASIWADPHEGKFIGNFQSTEVAYEIKQGFLNNLPLMIDDSSNIKDRDKFNYSTFIYNRCNEKGKSRSNISRGIEVENTWRHIILMTGEQPFMKDNAQGGAINRTLELCCGAEAIYKDPSGLADLLDVNFGFAGKDFIENVQALTPHEVKKIYKRQLERVNALDKMQKQSNALAAILTADEIAEKAIFKDGILIDIEEAATVLTDKKAVSEDIRCYEYLLEQIAINNDRFVPIAVDPNTNRAVFKSDQWGEYDKSKTIVYIIKSIFDRLCVQNGFSPKRFLDWAKKNRKIVCSKAGEYTKPKRLVNSATIECVRCVCLIIDTPQDEDNQDQNENNIMEGVPF